jgi:hypothetical protein
MAQQREAKRGYNQYASSINPATVAGLASLDRDIQNQEKNLSRQEQLISQIDPTVIEASQQALKLLRGEQASSLGPMKAQREQQRQKLQNSLREQLGAGAETSTAGIQALTRFDSETNQLYAGAQQQALSNLGGVAGQFNAIRPDMLRELSGLSGFGQAKTGLEFQRAQGLLGASQGLQQTAGAKYAADVARGQQASAFGGQLMSLGGMALGGALGGAGAAGAAGGAAAGAGASLGGMGGYTSGMFGSIGGP